MPIATKIIDEATGEEGYSLDIEDPEILAFMDEDPKHMEMFAKLFNICTRALSEAMSPASA